jgi:hypothetical protein
MLKLAIPVSVILQMVFVTVWTFREKMPAKLATSYSKAAQQLHNPTPIIGAFSKNLNGGLSSAEAKHSGDLGIRSCNRKTPPVERPPFSINLIIPG